MAGFAERTRTRDVKWQIFLPVLFAVLCLFGWIAMEQQRKLTDLKQEEADLRVQLTMSQSEEASLKVKLSNVGSTSSMDSEARAMSFVRPGEIRFEVVDAELLDKYTEKEWAALMEAGALGRY